MACQDPFRRHALSDRPWGSTFLSNSGNVPPHSRKVYGNLEIGGRCCAFDHNQAGGPVQKQVGQSFKR